MHFTRDLHGSMKKSRNSASAHLSADLKFVWVLREHLQATVSTVWEGGKAS